MRVTLDWNYVIEIEEGREQAQEVSELIKKHRCGELEVALLAALASENTPTSADHKGRRFPGNASLFTERVERLGCGDLPIVSMPAITGLRYIDFSYFVEDGDAFRRDVSALWEVIAPNVPSNSSAVLLDGQNMNDELMQSAQLAKWRDTWCDVISAYSHIQAGRDVFITLNTRDF